MQKNESRVGCCVGVFRMYPPRCYSRPKEHTRCHKLLENTIYANVIKATWSLVLARNAGRRDIVFADLMSGRAGVESRPVRCGRVRVLLDADPGAHAF